MSALNGLYGYKSTPQAELDTTEPPAKKVNLSAGASLLHDLLQHRTKHRSHPDDETTSAIFIVSRIY